MAAVRQVGTAPELATTCAARRRGDPGVGVATLAVAGAAQTSPGIGLQVAVFVDGAFWHGHPSRHQPGRSGAYWDEKIATNAQRDRRVDAELAAAGWLVLHISDSRFAGSPRRSWTALPQR